MHNMSTIMPFQKGEQVTFTKTVGETDVYLFAGITGDFADNHINDEYMSSTPFKRRIAHGVLSIGYSSTASTKIAEKAKVPVVSYGYDGIRFIKPIFIGDTITVNYTVIEIDTYNMKTIADIKITNQNNELCTVAKHIMKYITEDVK